MTFFEVIILNDCILYWLCFEKFVLVFFILTYKYNLIYLNANKLLTQK